MPLPRNAALLPIVWGFATAAALDQIFDIKKLFLPSLIALAAVTANDLLLRRAAQ